jgi:hypothetical protein
LCLAANRFISRSSTSQLSWAGSRCARCRDGRSSHSRLALGSRPSGQHFPILLCPQNHRSRALRTVHLKFGTFYTKFGTIHLKFGFGRVRIFSPQLIFKPCSRPIFRPPEVAWTQSAPTTLVSNASRVHGAATPQSHDGRRALRHGAPRHAPRPPPTHVPLPPPSLTSLLTDTVGSSTSLPQLHVLIVRTGSLFRRPPRPSSSPACSAAPLRSRSRPLTRRSATRGPSYRGSRSIKCALTNLTDLCFHIWQEFFLELGTPPTPSQP